MIYKFFDKLEDKVRGKLSHWPILYAFLGGVGIVVFWRGVWHTADYMMESIYFTRENPLAYTTIDLGGLPWWDGPLSIMVGTALLLVSGTFVSSFIGNEIIISGLRGEKKLAEKTEAEVKTETGAIGEVRREVMTISEKLDKIEKKLL